MNATLDIHHKANYIFSSDILIVLISAHANKHQAFERIQVACRS